MIVYQINTGMLLPKVAQMKSDIANQNQESCMIHVKNVPLAQQPAHAQETNHAIKMHTA
jgi:hypothetical protein